MGQSERPPETPAVHPPTGDLHNQITLTRGEPGGGGGGGLRQRVVEGFLYVGDGKGPRWGSNVKCRI